MCRLYGKFASYLRRVLCKTRLIFPRINGPIYPFGKTWANIGSNTTNGSSSGRIMRLVPVLILETHNQTNYNMFAQVRPHG